jgi:hypothetical protein
MKCLEGRDSPNEGLSTFDAPDGIAAGGLSEIVPCAAASVAAHDRLMRLNERLYIANEGMYDLKAERNDRSEKSQDAQLCLSTGTQS